MNIRRKLHTHETADALTRAQLRQAKRRNSSDSVCIISEFIACGRGNERPSDYQTKDDPLSEAARRIAMEHEAIMHAARKFTGPGREFTL